jgi:uncharacterized protein
MPASGELLVGLVMLVGLVGVIVPVLPGLALIWVAGLAWAWLDGGGTARWLVFALMTVLLATGTAAKYALPARHMSGAGAPRTTLLLGAVGAIAGFFLIPVVGFAVGGVAAVFLAELSRLGDVRAAGRSTRAVLIGIGFGVLIELTAGFAMVAVWLLAVLAT